METKISPEKPVKKFTGILGRGLGIALESTVLKLNIQNPTALESLGFVLDDPNKDGQKSDAKTMAVKHPVEVSGINLLDDIYFSATPESKLEIQYLPLPKNLEMLFQRIILKAGSIPELKGLACARFENHPPFPVKNRNNGSPYVALDFFSKTKIWNPLFVKYLIDSQLEPLRIGYIKIEAEKNQKSGGLITIKRVTKDEVPPDLAKNEVFLI